MTTAIIEAPVQQQTATATQLQARFGISQATWRRWAAEGRLTVYRVSARRLLFDVAEAEALIRATRSSGQSTNAT
jgi:predicted site-specific integrase-resolvase